MLESQPLPVATQSPIISDRRIHDVDLSLPSSPPNCSSNSPKEIENSRYSDIFQVVDERSLVVDEIHPARKRLNISRSAQLIKIKGAIRSSAGTEEKTEIEQEGEEDERLLRKQATSRDDKREIRFGKIEEGGVEWSDSPNLIRSRLLPNNTHDAGDSMYGSRFGLSCAEHLFYAPLSPVATTHRVETRQANPMLSVGRTMIPWK
ncbi:hypothetical protein ACLOJK_011534 [Asimina triloba]